MSLPVVEIFDSVQGEGPYIHPAIFLRTALCNFSCKGFDCSHIAPDGTQVTGCDTIRAVSVKFKDSWTDYSDSKSLISELLSHKRIYPFNFSQKQDLVITGGEPLLHFSNPVLTETIEYFKKEGHRIIVETNASVDRPYMFTEKTGEILKGCTFSMSVKLSCSKEEKQKRVKPELIDYLFDKTRDSYLKFVVSKESIDEDIAEIQNIISSLQNKIPVYLMPMAKDKRQLDENCACVLEKCIEYGFNYTDRIHIRAWNTREGV